MSVLAPDSNHSSTASGPGAPAEQTIDHGIEWIVDAAGCDPAALRDAARLGRLFERLVAAFQLTPVAPPVWHTFPFPGGITGFVVLAESHLACHTFPEFGSACVNVFCCRPRPDVDVAAVMSEALGASSVVVRVVDRRYARAERVTG